MNTDNPLFEEALQEDLILGLWGFCYDLELIIDGATGKIIEIYI